MNTSRQDLTKLLTDLKKQVNLLATKKIEEASKEIDSYLKVVEAEKKRRGK